MSVDLKVSLIQHGSLRLSAPRVLGVRPQSRLSQASPQPASDEVPRFIDHDWATAGLLSRPSVDDGAFLIFRAAAGQSRSWCNAPRPSWTEPSSRPHHKIRRRGVLHDIRQPRCLDVLAAEPAGTSPVLGWNRQILRPERPLRSRLNCPRSRRDLIGHRCVIRVDSAKGSTGDLKRHPV